jgi:hypothetical protein
MRKYHGKARNEFGRSLASVVVNWAVVCAFGALMAYAVAGWM